MFRYAVMLLIGSLSLLSSLNAFADTVYIRDTLYVPLRGGQSTEYRILHRGLKSGTPLERLVTNEESGYTRVRTPDGLEGWLQTQYLVEEPIAADRLNDVQTEVVTLEAEHQQALLRLRLATEELEELTEEYESLRSLAGNVEAINTENVELTNEMEAVRSQMALISERNTSLESGASRQWFLAGGGTVLAGLLFGFWVGRRIYQKRGTGGWA